MSDALTLEGIEKAYNRGKPNEVTVLRGASLTIETGEVVALVAPSGAGKSTLLHIAGLLDTADAGRVTLGGTDMTDLSDKRRTVARRREAGFVYQFHHLLPEFSALENVVLPQLANGVSKPDAQARARDLLATVGVASRASHRVPYGRGAPLPRFWGRGALTRSALVGVKGGANADGAIFVDNERMLEV